MHSSLGAAPGDEGAETSRVLAQKLRELPAEQTPPFDWAELQRRARLPRRRPLPGYDHPSPARSVILLAAAAASVLVAVLIADRQIRTIPIRVDRSTPAQGAVAREPVHRTALPSRVSRDDADSVLRRAAAAERWLASQPEDAPIVQVGTYVAVTDLEDRIASVDDLLNVERLRNAHARVYALQLERAQLVDSLAQVRYAEMLTTP